MAAHVRPPKQGLYDPRLEHDSCGVGFLVHLKGHRSHAIVEQAITALANLNTFQGMPPVNCFRFEHCMILSPSVIGRKIRTYSLHIPYF